MDIQSYICAHRERFMEEWSSLIRIPSVSCQPEHKADMQRCAERWKELLLAAGCQKAEVLPSKGNPFVYAEYKCQMSIQRSRSFDRREIRNVNSQIPTVLVYAHYDVMPVEPLEQWKSDPWEPSIRDGRLYARGADDDKGQAMIQAKAFEYMVQTGQLRCNVKFIFEGEEEIGSPSLEAFLEDHKEMLKADIILVSDTSMIGKDTPSLTTGLRGLAYWQIEVDGPNRDLHSGHFGGAVKNPVNALCEMIAKVVDQDGRITIPGFYDDVLPIPEAERAMIAQIPFSQEAYNKAIDVDDVFGEAGYSTLERNSCRPSFDVCGIWGGYTGEGSKTVLPSKAYAKVSCRLVANQDHEKISKAFVEYMQSIAPKGVRVTDARLTFLPIRLPSMVLRWRSVSVLWLLAAEVRFLSSLLLNRSSAARRSSWALVWSRMQFTRPTSPWISRSGRKASLLSPSSTKPMHKKKRTRAFFYRGK